MTRLRVVCATTNPGKAAEIAALLGDAVELLPRPADMPDVVEDADSLEANARKKAHAVAEATGLPALADDTGLEVTALGGAPGVRTARFAGEHASDAGNRAHLLDALARAGATDRSARFRTVAVVAWPDGTDLIAEGVCPGTIARAARGQGGFGYDPLFIPYEGNGRTFAEMTPSEKDALSHRGRAMREVRRRLYEA